MEPFLLLLFLLVRPGQVTCWYGDDDGEDYEVDDDDDDDSDKDEDDDDPTALPTLITDGVWPGDLLAGRLGIRMTRIMLKIVIIIIIMIRVMMMMTRMMLIMRIMMMPQLFLLSLLMGSGQVTSWQGCWG